MAERGRYRTKQQSQILDCLKGQDMFLTVEQLVDDLHGQGLRVGQTTVYRALDRLTQEGLVIKIPSVNGSRAQYRYLGDEVHGEPGKMVCLSCGHVLPLECDMLDGFAAHICASHGFSQARQYMILYGYCSQCRDLSENGAMSRLPDSPGDNSDAPDSANTPDEIVRRPCGCCGQKKNPAAISGNQADAATKERKDLIV
ncbi:MAG: transcriptional repressor [Clostridiales bacterium]|nr:transcriptional repressor [Clostridiales bacterium]